MPKSVLVLGGGVGGLSAAIYSRLHGHDVQVVEQHRVGGKAAGLEVKGYRLDPGPSIIILRHVYESLFRDAGRGLEDYLSFERLDPITRVYTEGSAQGIDLPADREECLSRLSELAPEDESALRNLMSTMDKVAPHIEQSIFKHPFHSAWQLMDRHLLAFALPFDSRLSYKQQVDRWFSSPLLRAFFYGFPSYGGQSYHSKAPGALMIPYLMLAEGVFYPRGGVAAIPAALERLARELGVKFRTGTRIAGLRTSRSRIVAAETEDGLLTADAFISNIDRLTTRGLLGAPSSAAPSFSYFTVHWGIRKGLRGLAHHNLLIPSDFGKGFEELYGEKKLPAKPILYLNTAKDSAPAGCTNLFAVVTSPAREDHLDWRRLEVEGRQTVIESLGKFGFEWKPQDIDFERIQSPIYFEETHGNYRGSLYGPDEKERLFGGLFPLRCADEDWPNLFYCGGSVQPGAGLPMVILSGKFAADLVGS
ncbi:MAG TPA: phytoene desaturase family protein [Fimbriimonas sp.]|nr:phytoene desaturase family protein [Fimbriimonas sp.]